MPDTFGSCSSASTCDVDNAPVLSGNPGTGLTGDGFTNFEEYRGFIVRGEHRRTNPWHRDVFISSEIWAHQTFIGIVYGFPALPTATHRVFSPTQGIAEYVPSTRVINANFQNGGAGGNIPGHVDQRALSVVDGGDSNSYAGCLFRIGVNACDDPNNDIATPNETDRLEVYVTAILRNAAAEPFNYDSTQQVKAVRFVVGHEIGHGVHMCHRPAPQSCTNSPGTSTSLMDFSAVVVFAPDPGEPRANYNTEDEAQLRLHQH